LLVDKYQELIESLASYIIAADTTGNGFCNIGCANTVDDASAAIQFAKEQTYLAVKAFCGLWAACLMLQLPHTEAAVNPKWERLVQQMRRILETLNTSAWLGDHFAVCLETDRSKVWDSWKGAALEPGELEGWDSYHIYTASGLFYPLYFDAKLPSLEILGPLFSAFLMHLKQDLPNARAKCLREYGSSHSSHEQSVWVSQCLFRDFVAKLLGVRLPSDAERYWKLQLSVNRAAKKDWGGFADCQSNRWLSYYPRGATALGWLLLAQRPSF